MRFKLSRYNYKENYKRNHFELAGSSSYQRLELPGVNSTMTRFFFFLLWTAMGQSTSTSTKTLFVSFVPSTETRFIWFVSNIMTRFNWFVSFRLVQMSQNAQHRIRKHLLRRRSKKNKNKKRNHNSHDSEDDFRSGCRNVSQCEQQQFFSELH